MLGRILFSSVVMVLAFQPGGPGSNPVRTLYFCHAFIYSSLSLLWTLFVRLLTRSVGTKTNTCNVISFEPYPKRLILNSSKLKEFADDNFKVNENGRKFSKRVENTVGKEEIAR